MTRFDFRSFITSFAVFACLEYSCANHNNNYNTLGSFQEVIDMIYADCVFYKLAVTHHKNIDTRVTL